MTVRARITPALVLVLLWAPAPAGAEQARPRAQTAARAAVGAQSQPSPVQAPGAQPARAQAGPAQTAATYGDWIHRCVRTQTGESCEIFQQINGATPPERAVSMLLTLAIGGVSAADPLQINAVLPVNVALGASPRLVLPGGDMTEFTFVRCLGNACFATLGTPDRLLRSLSAEMGMAVKFEYRSATNAPVVIPVSLKGYADAFEALQKSRQH